MPKIPVVISLSGRSVSMPTRKLSPNETRLHHSSDSPSAPQATPIQRSHSKGWNGDSVELDAIAPDALRTLVRDAIERYMPPEQLRMAKIAEESEREMFESWAKRLKVKAS